MTKISEVVQAMNKLCPEYIQEKWDNSGLQWGDSTVDCTGVMVSLDVTMDIMMEAKSLGFNLIIAHHPPIFNGLKRVDKNGSEVERLLYFGIENKIAVYAAHTNWDKANKGVSYSMANRLQLGNIKNLVPEKNTLCNIKVMGLPVDCLAVRNAWFDAGLGSIGSYSHCSFTVNGTGTFLPNEGSNPSVGHKGDLTEQPESAVEILCSLAMSEKALNLAQSVSSYETIAYSITPLANKHYDFGFGCIGELNEALDQEAFLAQCKEAFSCESIRFNPAKISKKIKTVALCGGSAIDFLPHALAHGADAYLTADIKYHQFLQADGALLLVDLGHYESEIWAMKDLAGVLKENFSNFAVRLTTTNSNSVRYF